MKAFLKSIALPLLATIAIVQPVVAVELASSGDPVKSGAGRYLRARFNNVATIDGQSIDLHARILSQTSTKTNDFWQGAPYALPGDFCFSFKEGEPGEERSATVRWTFYLSGTNTPVRLSGLVLTIDDLDDDSGRTESLETPDAVGYTVDSSSVLTANSANGGVAVSAKGAGQQDPGNPASAVRLHMQTASSFTFTYHVTFGSATSSAFHHDAAGNFTFSDPVYEPVPPASALPQIYFTYNVENDNEHVIKAMFSDRAPAGCTWDTGYSPFVSHPDVGVNIAYSSEGLVAESGGMEVPPGGLSFTLRTLPTTRTGLIENEATIIRYGDETESIVPAGESKYLTSAQLEASSEIESQRFYEDGLAIAFDHDDGDDNCGHVVISSASVYLPPSTNIQPVLDLDGAATIESLPPDLATVLSNGSTALSGGTTVSSSVFGVGTSTPAGGANGGGGVRIYDADRDFLDPTNTFNNYAVWRMQFDRPVVFSGSFDLYDVDWSQRGSVFGSLAGAIVPPDSLSALGGVSVRAEGDFGILPAGITSGGTIPILRATGVGTDNTKDGTATFSNAEIDTLYFVWNVYRDYDSDSSVSIKADGELTVTSAGLGNYEEEYSSAAVHVASFDSEISDPDDSNMESARIVLTNAKAGDGLFVGAISNSLTSDIDNSVPGAITLTLSGTATKEDYARAIESVTFSSSLPGSDTSPRTIEVTVNDGESDSNTAITTIAIAAE